MRRLFRDNLVIYDSYIGSVEQECLAEYCYDVVQTIVSHLYYYCICGNVVVDKCENCLTSSCMNDTTHIIEAGHHIMQGDDVCRSMSLLSFILEWILLLMNLVVRLIGQLFPLPYSIGCFTQILLFSKGLGYFGYCIICLWLPVS